MDQGYGSCSTTGYGSRYGSGGMDRVWVRGLDPYLVFSLVPKYVCVHVYVYVYVYVYMYVCLCIYVCLCMRVWNCQSSWSSSVILIFMIVPIVRPFIHQPIHPSIHSLLGTHLQKGLISDDFLTSSRAEMLQDKRIAGVMLGLWVLCIVFPTHQCQH